MSTNNLAEFAKEKGQETLSLADRYLAENNIQAMRGLLEKAIKDQETVFRAMELLCGSREVPARADQVDAIKEVALASIELAKLNMKGGQP